MSDENLFEQFRFFLKDTIRKTIDFSQTDQHRGMAPPSIEKPFAEKARRIDLIPPGQLKELGQLDLFSAIQNRESRRDYSRDSLTLAELSFLLWATQGVRRKLDAGHALRTVPSAGCRHALETYLCVLNVRNLDPGMYRWYVWAISAAGVQASSAIVRSTLRVG